MSKSRDEYVSGLKKQLDRWNREIDAWERRGEKVASEVRARYDNDLRLLRERREKAMYQLQLLEGASATAWQELSKGADEAWQRMRAAIEKARTQFT